jgi:hypothetical protein
MKINILKNPVEQFIPYNISDAKKFAEIKKVMPESHCLIELGLMEKTFRCLYGDECEACMYVYLKNKLNDIINKEDVV